MNTNEVKQKAIDLFNETWDLIDLKERSIEENILMIHKAHASCLLWSEINELINIARGEWQISRVYSILSMGESALLHGEHSLKICSNNDISDFDLAFGYESVARAYSVLGNANKKDEYKNLAIAACENIKEKDDREYAESEIKNIK